jgi:hypothetical protein
MNKILLVWVIFTLGVFSIIGCSNESEKNKQSLTPKQVVELSYQAAENSDWEKNCLLTSRQSQQRLIQQVTAISKQVSVKGASLSKDPSCIEVYEWLDKASKQETGSSLGQLVKGYQVVDAQITGNKAVVTSFRELPGSDEKETNDVNLIKINERWLLND